MREIFQYIFMLFLLAAFEGCKHDAAEGGQKQELIIVENIDTDIVFEMGALKLGDHKELTVKLYNALKKPVVINEMNRFCGCTIPEYSSAPILPSDSIEVKIIFISDQLGTFNKAVRMYLSSQEKPIDIVLNGEIVKKDL